MHPCATCATLRRTCCQEAEILVTRGDHDRIAAAIGRDDFAERRRPADPAYLDWDPEDPDWLDLTTAEDGSRIMLRRHENGDCVFLGSAGCTLDEETRPLVCRLYPFAYDAGGLGGVAQEYCPTELFRHLGPTMVEVLGMKAEKAETWRRMLYAELRRKEHDECASG